MRFERDGAEHLMGEFDPALAGRILKSAKNIARSMAPGAKTNVAARDIILDGASADRLLVTPAIFDMATRYLGHEPVPCRACHVRTQPPERRPLPFHQDETILGHRLLNVWVPLVECGLDAPGLQVVIGSWPRLLPTIDNADGTFVADHFEIPPDKVLDSFPAEAFYAPAFQVGDAMVFAGSTIHRTFVTSSMTAKRVCVEIRLM